MTIEMGFLILSLMMMSVLVAAQDDLGPGFEETVGQSRAETTDSTFLTTVFAKARLSSKESVESSLKPTPTTTKMFTTPTSTTFVTTSTANYVQKVGKMKGNTSTSTTTNESITTTTTGRDIRADISNETAKNDNNVAMIRIEDSNEGSNETISTTTNNNELTNTGTNDTWDSVNDFMGEENDEDGVNREGREKELLSNSTDLSNSTRSSEESDLLELSELASFGDDMSNLTKTNWEHNELVLNLRVNESQEISSTEVSLSDAPIVVADRENKQETAIEGLSLQVQIYILGGAFGTLIFLTILFLVTLFLRVESVRNELRRTATQSRYQVEPAQHTVLSQPRAYDNGGYGGAVEMQERPVDAADSELRRMGYNVYNGRSNRDDTVDSRRKRPMSAVMRYDESVIADRRNAPGGRVRTLDSQRY